jgi:hypothetical protein
LTFAVPAAAKIEVRATLSPERIGVGEIATLAVEITNDSLSSIRFSPHFALENFEPAGEVEQMNDLRYGSNGLSRTFRVFWRLRPRRVGTAAVRKISIEVNGTVLPLTDREVRVQSAPTMAPVDPLAGQDEDPFGSFFGRMVEPLRRLRQPRQPALFLRQEVEPKNAVVGQQMLYTVYLYARRDVEAMSQDELPKFKGFWVRDIPQGQRLRSDFVEIGGETYARVAVVRKALFPLRAGLYHFGPASFDFAVRAIDNNFFGPTIERSEPVHLISPPTNVNVLPLPAGPSEFAGAVGRVTLLASLTPQQVRMGEAATLTLSLGGEGNLHTIDDLKVVAPPELELSTPQHDGRDEVRGTTVLGDRTWTYSVIPKGIGSFTLQPPRVSYFDPRMGEYRIAAASPLTLTVLPAEPKTGAAAETEGAAKSPGRGSSDRFRQVLPWGIAGLSTLAALAAFAALVRRRPASLSGPADVLRPLPPNAAQAAKVLREALDLAARESRASAFAQKSEAAWRSFLEASYALPPGTPTVRWSDVLALQGRNGALRTDLEKLLEDLRYLRYAPQLASVDDVRQDAMASGGRVLSQLLGKAARGA